MGTLKALNRGTFGILVCSLLMIKGYFCSSFAEKNYALFCSRNTRGCKVCKQLSPTVSGQNTVLPQKCLVLTSLANQKKKSSINKWKSLDVNDKCPVNSGNWF